MILYVILGTLAAFGLLSGLWVLFGWLLPGSSESVLLFLCSPEKKPGPVLLRYRWLRELHLIRGPLILVGSDLSEQAQQRIRQRYRGVEFCSPEALASRLELERQRIG